MAMGSTKRQAQLLRFVHGYMLANGGVAPTHAQCVTALGLVSRANATRLFRGLEERGKIRRLSGRPRAIEVLDPPAIPSIDNAPLYAVPMVGQQQAGFSGERL